MLDIEITGDGADVVLLHGVPVSPKSVAAIRDHLGQNYRVLTPDMAGIGLEPASAISQLEHALVKRGCTEAVVVGHSFGAYRAFQLALSGVIGVSRIVAIGPMAYYPDRTRRRQLELADAIEAGHVTVDEVVASVLPRWFRSNASDDKDTAVEAARSWFDGMNEDSFVRALRVECDIEDLRPRLADIDAPTCLLVGEHDKSTPPEWARTITERLPDSELVVLDGVGHFPHIEARATTFDTIDAFLNM